MRVSNNLLAFLAIMAIFSSLSGTMVILLNTPMKSPTITGMATPTAQGNASVYIPSEISIELVTQVVDFKTHSTTHGSNNDTGDLSPLPFRLKNNGSALINVSIAEDNSSPDTSELWAEYDTTHEQYFQFNSTYITSSNADYYVGWTDFSAANKAEYQTAAGLLTDPANLVMNLTTAGEIYVHINISTPDGAEEGQYQTKVYFKAGAGT